MPEENTLLTMRIICFNLKNFYILITESVYFSIYFSQLTEIILLNKIAITNVPFICRLELNFMYSVQRTLGIKMFIIHTGTICYKAIMQRHMSVVKCISKSFVVSLLWELEVYFN